MTVFRTSRSFPAPPGAVFAAFADPARLAGWWGPEGFTNTIHSFDFRTGGRWLFDMHGPDGQTWPNECEFTSVVEPGTIVIRHVGQPRFELTVTLEAAEGGTLVTWAQAFEDASVASAIRHIVEPANEQNLDRWLAALGFPKPR